MPLDVFCLYMPSRKAHAQPVAYPEIFFGGGGKGAVLKPGINKLSE
jgi:hypothetical protein